MVWWGGVGVLRHKAFVEVFAKSQSADWLPKRNSIVWKRFDRSGMTYLSLKKIRIKGIVADQGQKGKVQTDGASCLFCLLEPQNVPLTHSRFTQSQKNETKTVLPALSF